MKINITWLLIDAFIIVILDTDSALHVEYLDVVPCGVSVVIKSYRRGGPATIRNSTSLLQNHKDKQNHQVKHTWNGFRSTALRLTKMIMQSYMNIYLPIGM